MIPCKGSVNCTRDAMILQRMRLIQYKHNKSKNNFKQTN